jgi:hypothetical protein
MIKPTLARVLVPALLLTATATTLAQPTPSLPKPGAEQKKLDFFAGRWTSQSDTRPSPFGPAARITGNESCEWFAGGFQLICHSETKSAMGERKGMAVWSFDPAEKAYTYYGFDSSGMAFVTRGTTEAGVWTWLNEMKMGDKTVKSRVTIKEISADAYTFKWETSSDGTSWTPLEEGTATRAK